MERSHIKKRESQRLRNVCLVLSLAAPAFATGGIEVDIYSLNTSSNNPNGDWKGIASANGSSSISITNNAAATFPRWGVRLSFPTGENIQVKSGSNSPDIGWVAPNYMMRYDMIRSSKISGASYDATAGTWTPTTSSLSVKGGGPQPKWPDNTPPTWTPYNEHIQILAKTRSFADMGDFVDANPVTVDQIDSLMNTALFYDENHYVPDSLGHNAPLYGGGFIDTYMNQYDSIPITQVQFNFFPDDVYAWSNIGKWVKFRPDLMGVNDPKKGAGPLYSMGLVAVQELMHIDWQFMSPMALTESEGAFETYGNMGLGNGQGTPDYGSGGYSYGTSKYGKNSSAGYGTMHMEPTGFADKAYGTYPDFFPYPGNIEEWFGTPSSNNVYTRGNSAQVVNSLLIGTLYCWKGYEQLFRAEDFYAKGIFENAKDRSMAAKLYMWGWQAGFSSSKGGTYSGPLYKSDIESIEDITPLCSDYVKNKVWPVTKVLLESQRNSVLNTASTSAQNSEVMDMPITLDDIAEFFYGNDVPPYNSITFAESGTLGKGGALQHFSMSQTQRSDLWIEIVAAFNKMKGKAPSGYSDAVSFRYDWLTILRIAKGYIYPQMFNQPFKPVMLPTPTDVRFKNWVSTHSQDPIDIPDLPLKDEAFPSLLIKNYDVNVTEDFLIEIRGGDNEGLNITTEGQPSAEWSIDPTWQIWHTAEFINGAEKDANFRATIPSQTIKDAFGEKDGMAWVRITDKVGNSTIESIVVKGVKHPRLDSAFIVDTLGDGVGRTIYAHLTKGGADDADELDAWTLADYTWPSQLAPFLSADANTTVLNGSVLTITEPTFVDGAGRGLLKMDYPSRSGYEKDILDRVGPALVKTAHFGNEDGRISDTLLIAVSEPLKDEFPNLGDYFGFSQTETGTVTTEIIDSVGLLNTAGDSVMVILPKGTIKSKGYLWVKLLSTNGVKDRDLNENRPADYSQLIPILIKGSNTTIENAAAFDTYGDGISDSVLVRLLEGGAADHNVGADVVEVRYKWNNSAAEQVVSKSNIKVISTDQISFDIDTNIVKHGDGVGEITVKFSNGHIEGTIVDSTGPAIETALLDITNAARPNDLLQLTISEVIESALTQDKAHLMFKKGADITTINSSAATMVSGDEWTFAFANGEIAQQEFVKFVSDDEIKDIEGNLPLIYNQWIPLSVIGGVEPQFVSSFIVDRDGDGAGDSIAVQLKLGEADDRYTVSSLVEVEYSWNDKVGFDQANVATLSDKSDSDFGILDGSFTTGYGEGEVHLLFPNDFPLEGPISDKVGPAIYKATRLYSESSENDTVEITITESLGNSFNDNSTYFAITDLINGTVDTESKSVEKVDETTYRVIFPFNTVQDLDSISFVVNGGVVDAVSNKPADNNKRIPITIIGGKRPTIENASMYDVDGNGTADLIRAVLKLGSDKKPEGAMDFTDAQYSWPNPSPLLSDATVKALDSTTITLTGMDIKKTAGNGQLQLTFPSGGESSSIDDKVGPVIVKALLWENLTQNNDTLQIRFSEEVSSIVANAMTINVDGSPQISPVAEQFKGSSTTWLFSFAKGTVALDDSVNIVVESGLVDSKGNKAHPENIKVIIEEKRRPIGIDEGQSGYYDSDADGVMDQIKITLDGAVDQNRIDEFEAEFTWPSTAGIGFVETISVDASKISADGSNVITVDLSGEDIISGMTYLSDAFGELTLRQPNDDNEIGVLHEDTFTPLDKMAPVLIETAMYRGKHLKSDEEFFGDTLIVNYSEEVVGSDLGLSTENYMFGLQDLSESGSAYELAITKQSIHNGQTVSYVVQVERNVSVIPARGDSIRITGSGDIVDKQNNVQSSTTPYVPFETVVLPAEYEVIIYPNPFVIDADTTNELVAKYGDGMEARGKLAVLVRPYGNRVGENLQGWITTFDAVGNVIADNEEITLMSGGVLLYTTDGKNSAGRAVGSGSYRSIITVKSGTGDDEQVNSIPVMIGVKKQSTVTE